MSRSRKNIQSVAESLSNLERLLFSQAVYEFGSNAWSDVARVLSTHPLIQRPKQFFTPESSDAIYKFLVEAAGVKLQPSDALRHSEGHKMLAQGHYATRVIELKSLIEEEEERFKTLVTEIEEIRAGKWDDHIMRDLGLKPVAQDETEDKQNVTLMLSAEVCLPDVRDTQSLEETVVERQETRDAVEQSAIESNIPPAVQHIEEVAAGDKEPVDEVLLGGPQLLDYPSSPAAEEEVEEQTAPIDLDSEEANVADAAANGTDQDPEAVPSLGNSVAHSPESSTVEPDVNMEDNVAEAETETTAQNEEAENCAAYPAGEMIPTPSPSPPSGEAESDTYDTGVEPQADIVEGETASVLARPLREESPAVDGEADIEIEAEGQADKQGGIEEDVLETELGIENEPEFDAEEADAEVGPTDVDVRAEAEETVITGALPSGRPGGKRKVSDADLPDGRREPKRVREASEATEEEEPGPTSARLRRKSQAPAEGPVVSKRFQNVIGMLHSTISQHRYGNIFHNPIKKSEAPDYHDIVKRPMDLKTIKARVKDGLISNSLQFQRDVYLMFANAMMYNRPGSEIYNMAEEMMLESEVHINTFRQTEGFHRG